MELTFASEKTIDRADEGQPGHKREPSLPSPEEGLRLVQAFLRVERTNLREEIFKFIEQTLRRQDGHLSDAI